jgi:hypothetical protein
MNRIRLLACAILDGTLISIDRVTDQRPYLGKRRRNGVTVQVIAHPAGWRPTIRRDGSRRRTPDRCGP